MMTLNLVLVGINVVLIGVWTVMMIRFFLGY